MSCSTSSQSCVRSHSSASAGDAAGCDAYPACFSSSASDAVTDGSSSTMRIMESCQ